MGVIPVEEFEQHCINQHKCRDAGFEAEYEVCLQRNAHYIKIIMGSIIGLELFMPKLSYIHC